MRVLVVGYGSAGKRHARIAETMNCEIAVSDLSPERREEARKAGYDVDMPALGSDVSAVVIATPAATHASVARELLRDGYEGPLLVEKPLDTSLVNEDLWREWPHLTTAVGYNWRFIVADGKRDARLVKACCLTDMREWPGEGYDHPLLECSHEFDLVRRILGDGEVVRASVSGTAWDIATLHGGGLIARYHIDTQAALPLRTMSIRGPEGSEVGGYRVEPDVPSHAHMIAQSYRAQMKAFLAAAKRGRPVRGCSIISDGLAAIAWAGQATELAATGGGQHVGGRREAEEYSD